MIKIGFKDFIYGLVEKKVSSMYDTWKEEEKGKIISTASEKKLKTGLNLFGQGASALGAVGITGLFTAPMQPGRAKAQSEVQFWIDRTFSPIINELRWFGGRLEAEWGPYFYENRAAGFIGKYIGMGLGALAAFLLPIPGGPIVGAAIGGAAGEFLGPGVQAGLDYWASISGTPKSGIDNLSGTLLERMINDGQIDTKRDDSPEDIIYDRTGPSAAPPLSLRVASRRAEKISKMSWI